uniref:Uncharacterized protein n=1 Tax=Rhizophora mucronata TaxID=61149 RepID=A0A2P2QFL8_RHIMU
MLIEDSSSFCFKPECYTSSLVPDVVFSFYFGCFCLYFF